MHPFLLHTNVFYNLTPPFSIFHSTNQPLRHVRSGEALPQFSLQYADLDASDKFSISSADLYHLPLLPALPSLQLPLLSVPTVLFSEQYIAPEQPDSNSNLMVENLPASQASVLLMCNIPLQDNHIYLS